MASWDDVRRIAMALPDVTEGASHGGPTGWAVKGKGFVWERPLRKADLVALGDAAPDGPILGVRTLGLEAKEALLAENPDAFFVTPHFDGYPAVLIRLEHIGVDELEEVILDAWVVRAPKRVSKAYLDLPERREARRDTPASDNSA
jgi:hypothetical protein